MAAAIVLGSVQGGVGKSTLTAGIAAALRAQGCTVATFTVGPGLATQPPGPSCFDSLPQQPVGLDGCLLDCDAARAAFHDAAAAADIALVEGCGGLFDGPAAACEGGVAGSECERGSTAHVAACLRAPLVLVVDAQAFSTPRAIAALVRGHAAGEGGCSVAGVILNRAPRPGLAADTQEALSCASLGVAVLGAVPTLADLEQLRAGGSGAAGVWPAAAATCSISLQGWMSCSKQQQLLAQHVAQHVDLQRLRQLARSAAVPQPQAPLPPPARTYRVSMAVAHDAAFYRYFQQNLQMLQRAGVQLLPFSPLHDSSLPPGLSAVLLGGGAVPAHARELAANAPMLQALRAFAHAGGYVLGEADGLMYLSQSLQLARHDAAATQAAQCHAMVGLFPFHTQAQPQPDQQAAAEAYVSVTTAAQVQHPLLLPGLHMTGLASCRCKVLDTRTGGGGSSSSSLDAPTTPQSCSSSSSSSSSSTDSGRAAHQPAHADAAAYTCSFIVKPLFADCAQAAARAADDGYTCGTALATGVQVHYGSCPELVKHIAKRCLRVDVASVTAAASKAASAAVVAEAAASAADSPRVSYSAQRVSLSVELPDGHSSPCFESTGGAADAAAAPAATPWVPSPSSRALSAPNLQQVLWQQAAAPRAAACEPLSAPASALASSAAAAAAAGHGAGGPSSAPATAAQLSPAKKSASVPTAMWQLGALDPQVAQQLLQHQLSQQQRQQQPFGARGTSCPAPHWSHAGAGAAAPGSSASDTGAGPASGRWTPPAFSVPKRWSMELQRLGSSVAHQLLAGGASGASGSGARSRQPDGSPAAASMQQAPGRQHPSRSSSRVMGHLPEEAPLSEAALQLLDSSLPSVLGRTHHTHIGLAVPLRRAGSSAASSAAGACLPPHGGSMAQAGDAAASISRSSSVHEQMSSLAASLAQAEGFAAGAAAGGDASAPGSVCGHPLRVSIDCASAATHHSDADTPSVLLWGQPQLQHGLQPPPPERPPQQQQQQQPQAHGQQLLEAAGRRLQPPQDAAAGKPPLSRQHRLSLDHTSAAQGSGGLRACQSAAALHRPSTDTGSSGPGSVWQHEPLLQPELSLSAGLGGAGVRQLAQDAAGAAPLMLPPMRMSKSSGKLSNWSAAATPTAAGTAAATPDAASFRSSFPGGPGSILSLSPAATDCLLALGLSSRVVGVTDACRLAWHGSGSGSSGRAGGACAPLVQLLDGVAAPWAGDATVAMLDAAAGGAPGCGGGPCGTAPAPDVVCRLVEGADGARRYKLDEDRIRELQPALVVVACDENSGDELAVQQHHQLLHKAAAARRRLGGAAAAAAAAAAGRGATAASAGGSMPHSSSLSGAVAVPGRVRLEPTVVQRVLQRAGVWGEGRALVLYQACHSLCEVLEFLQVLADAAGAPERGSQLAQALRARMRAAVSRVCMASERLAALPRRQCVVVLEGVAPLRLAGMWVPELLQLAGAQQQPDIAPAAGSPGAVVGWAALRAAAPDVVVLALPGLPASQAAACLADLADLPGFWGLPAVRAGAVYACDHALLLRPGPCLVAGLELLAHVAAGRGQAQAAVHGGLLPPGSVLKLGLHGGQRCRPRLVPHYMACYCC